MAIDSDINPDKNASENVLIQYNNRKEEMKNPKNMYI